MLRVDFFQRKDKQNGVPAGCIEYDPAWGFASSNDNLRDIITHCRIFTADHPQGIVSQDDPALWMQNLYLAFRPPYFWAAKVQEIKR